MVSLVGQHLKQCDSKIGRILLAPIWVELRNQIDQEAAKTGIVFRHVVDERLRKALGATQLRLTAVEVNRTAGFEIDRRNRILKVQRRDRLLPGVVGL